MAGGIEGHSDPCQDYCKYLPTITIIYTARKINIIIIMIPYHKNINNLIDLITIIMMIISTILASC